LEADKSSHPTVKRNIIVLNGTTHFVFLPEHLPQALEVQSSGKKVLIVRVCPGCSCAMYDAPARYQTSLRLKHSLCPECEDEQVEVRESPAERS